MFVTVVKAVAADWAEHSTSLVPLLWAGVVACAGGLVALSAYIVRRAEKSLGDRITAGFDSVALSIQRLEHGITHLGDKQEAQAKEMEEIKVRCAGFHGHQANGQWIPRSGAGRRASDYPDDQ